MEHYDPKSNLRFWPLESMARYGQNPFGENIWRIVHAPSRRSLVHGHGRKPKWLVTYPQAGDHWVLEKWLSAYDFTKCTAQTWNQSMTLLGPYPSRGEYELCHIFELALPESGNIEKLITWIEAGSKYSMYENMLSMRAEADREGQTGKSYREAVIRNALPAFGGAAMSGAGGGRGTKTNFDLPISANMMGLPKKAGHILQGTVGKYDVSHLIEG